MTGDKSQVRRAMRAVTRGLTPDELSRAARAVFRVIEDSEFFADSRHIMLYNALPDELPTAALLDSWHGDKTLYLPRMAGEGLEVVPADRPLTADNPYGIGEPAGPAVDPSVIELAIIPGLAFDRCRNRMGRGKGYYDRLLPLMPGAVTVGVCHHRQLVDLLPTDSHDIPVKAVVTPLGAIDPFHLIVKS